MQENVLLADEGHQAYRNRKTPNDNPYLAGSWQAAEWQFGWDCEEQSDSNAIDWTSGQFKETG